jgi:hypothetical protein
LWAFFAGLGSCTNLPVATEDAKAPDVFDRIRALDLLPRQPLPVDQNAQIGGTRGKQVLYTGVVVPATEPGARGQQAGGAEGTEGGQRTGGGATSSTLKTPRSPWSQSPCWATYSAWAMQ